MLYVMFTSCIGAEQIESSNAIALCYWICNLISFIEGINFAVHINQLLLIYYISNGIEIQIRFLYVLICFSYMNCKACAIILFIQDWKSLFKGQFSGII